MTEIAPVVFTWDGDAMVPLDRFRGLCDRQFVVGETYQLVVNESRSAVSHKHYFASVNEAWENLGEDLTVQFPTSEHLRKHALIKAGYCDKRSVVCASKAEALRVAAFIRPMDEYAIVAVSEATITVYTAKSQSMRAMGKQVFQESKQAVLDIVSGMIGVSPAALSANARRAA